MDCDVLIVGGGPAGLSLARSLADAPLRVIVVEKQPHAALEAPGYDGREIALTHRSIGTLKALGAWDLLPPEDVSPLDEARVLNGASPFALSFDPASHGGGPLSLIVPNHRIREALFRTVEHQPNLTLLAGVGVAALKTSARAAEVTLDDGRTLSAKLLVAADSRFSGVRDRLGIGAEVNRLGRSMMVCRVRHDGEHHGVATEWFDHYQTLAMLPLNGRRSSAVLTLPAAEMDGIAALDEAALGAELTRRYQGKLGRMEVDASAHVYPLATTWSRHFAATRAALIGDAAVGMHPVTAHGFNLGLQSQATLAKLVIAAAQRGRDIAAPSLLRRYEMTHRLASRPIYAATNWLVRLYTDERPGARIARHATLRAGSRLPLARQAITAMLMQR
ncbi:5-demethoxyubiquinol-8 5-hydroxylase UbiM [Sphingomonas sp. ac-8]|uniref:5-demethoxyubiquinol-8 5-hydroxylase UbiM n=1 Tax=Sphingomonas sp. ac-8 TaxID=3242977 RepID=UPI003A803239